jgi:hypothetical protein
VYTTTSQPPPPPPQNKNKRNADKKVLISSTFSPSESSQPFALPSGLAKTFDSTLSPLLQEKF